MSLEGHIFFKSRRPPGWGWELTAKREGNLSGKYICFPYLDCGGPYRALSCVRTHPTSHLNCVRFVLVILCLDEVDFKNK